MLKKFSPHHLPVLLLFFSKVGTYTAQSRAEIFWAIKHPVAALRIKKITKQCDDIYAIYKLQGKPDTLENGGQLDAFRHAFYMAAFAQRIKAKKVLTLGVAHEAGNYADFLKSKSEDGEAADFMACEMDLFNNTLGISLGSKSKGLLLDALAERVVEEIQNGNAVIIKRNSKGDYLTCSGQTINLQLYKNEWVIPKCLVRSDHQERQ